MKRLMREGKGDGRNDRRLRSISYQRPRPLLRR